MDRELDEAASLTRRDTLKRGLVVGGAVIWTVPTIQALGMSAAHAEAPSGKTVKPPKKHPHTQPPVTQVPPASHVVENQAAALPKTGSEIPVAGITAAAAGAIGAGAVILRATHKSTGATEA